ncbi:MAG: lysine--tRNA ligase [Deltaproteobacteria bacterium]|nr:lysine--tRNA ligase [Deltaproteobacteria bacterium]
MTEENYNQPRVDKVRALREKGVNPYPNGLSPNTLCRDIHDRFGKLDSAALEAKTDTFALGGRVLMRRSFGKAGFLKIRDRSGEIQIFCQKDSLPEADFEIYKDLDIGDFIFVNGNLFRTKTNELTIKASSLSLTVKSLQTLPEKWHGLTDVETRYRQRYVDLIANPEIKQIFIKRSALISEIRRFLLERDFLEVETPMMHPIPGGAQARPFVTHHNQLGMDLYLRIAPELYLKRLVVGGLERVFEINRNFRNEGISVQHNPEFTMLEFYQAYATYEDLMRMMEEMFSQLAVKICGGTIVSYQGEKLNFAAPFAKMTLRDSLVEIGKIPPQEADDKKSMEARCHKMGIIERGKPGGLGLYQTLLFEHLVEKELRQPTFITQFPTEVSPLSRKNDKNPEVSDRFEFFIYGREIANAFSELNDPQDQKERFQKQVEAKAAGDEEAMYFDADFIRALEYGMPPTAGCGVGIDRLAMILTDQPSIRDVILFPQMRPEK